MTTSPITHEVALRVSDLMSTAEISQQRLANATGIPLPTLRRRLLGVGQQSFNLAELEAIASFLKLTIFDLLPQEVRR
jgi:hypothetical protein